LKERYKGREDEEEDLSSYWMTLLETERGGSRLHSVENTLWNRLWICRKTDYMMAIVMMRKIHAQNVQK
jgi:hypothetical protein